MDNRKATLHVRCCRKWVCISFDREPPASECDTEGYLLQDIQRPCLSVGLQCTRRRIYRAPLGSWWEPFLERTFAFIAIVLYSLANLLLPPAIVLHYLAIVHCIQQ